jgi:hypothetical protein
MNIERFEDVEAWQLARKLTQKVYRLTKKPGFAKDYGLKKQIQDAAGSIILLKVSILRRIPSSSGSYGTPNGLARKFRASFM